MMVLGRAEGVITLNISDLQGKASAANAALSSIGQGATGGFAGLERQLNAVGTSTDQVGRSFLGLGAAILAPMTIGVKGAMDFEQQMKNVEVSLGDVSKHDFQQLTQQIIDIGASGQYSAGEIAIVSDELAKAGYEIKDIMSGDPAQGFGNMAKSVSDLASATGDGLLPATQAVTSAMATYSPAVVEATTSTNGFQMQVLDASRVADVFTVAANASRASTEDLNAGFRNFGSTAAAMGIPLEESVSAIAMFTNYGIKASDAGTSLTRAMTMLANPTQEASDLMAQLGIDAFDAQGKFIGMPQLFDQVKTALGGMSEEQRQAAIATIFGAEAMDVMTIAAMTGGDPLRDITDQTKEHGIAARQAAERVDTLKGAFERMREGISTALMVMASGLTPMLRAVADGIDFVTSMFLKLPGPVISAIGLVVTGIGLLSTAIGGLLIFGPRISAFFTTVRAISTIGGPLGTAATAFLRLTSAMRMLLLVGTGLGVLVGIIAALVKLDIGPFGEAWERAVDAFHQAADAGNVVVGVINAISAALKSFDIGPLTTLAGYFDAAGTAVLAFWEAFKQGGSSGAKASLDAATAANLQIQKIADTTGADGFRYPLVQVNVETGELEEVGQILESHDDPNNANQWWAKVKVDGKEYEVYIDKTTNEVIPIEVEVDPDQKVPSTMDRIRDGFERIQHVGKTLRMPWLENIGTWGINGVNAIEKFQDAFNGLRKTMNPVAAAFSALGEAFREMGWDTAADLMTAFGGALTKIPFDKARDAAVDLARKGFGVLQKGAEKAWDVLGKGGSKVWNGIQKGAGKAWDVVQKGVDTFGRLKDAFTVFRMFGHNPVEAALKSLGAVFPRLLGPITTIIDAFGRLKDAFSDLMKLDFSGFFSGIGSLLGDIGSAIMDGIGAIDFGSVFDSIGDAIRSAWASMLDGLGDLSDMLANWLAELFAPDTADSEINSFSGRLQQNLEESAKKGWSDAWANFQFWLGDQVMDIGGIVIRVGGWVIEQLDNLWDAVAAKIYEWTGASSAERMGSAASGYPVSGVLIRVGGWLVEQADNLWEAVRNKILEWIGGGGAGGLGSRMGGTAGGFPLGDVLLQIGGWIVRGGENLWGKVTEYVRGLMGLSGGSAGIGPVGGSTDGVPLGTITAKISDIAIDIADKAWASKARKQIDRMYEDAVGKTITYTTIVTIKVGIKILQDPIMAAKVALVGTLAAAFVGLAVSVGLGAALAVFGIPVLAYSIIQAARDYFDRNPQDLGRIKVAISEFWTEVKNVPILGDIAGIIEGIVKAGMGLVDFLRDLDGTAGSVVDTIAKVGAALTGLFFIAGIGGMGTKRYGAKKPIGFLGGLYHGLMAIAKFPFNLILHPVQAIKNLLDIPGRGRAGGRRVMLSTLDVLKGYVKLPFRVIGMGLQAFWRTLVVGGNILKGSASGIKAWSKAWERATAKGITGFPRLARSFEAMAGKMMGARNFGGALLRSARGIDRVGRVIADGLIKGLNLGLRGLEKALPKIGPMIDRLFGTRGVAAGIGRALNLSLAGLPGLLGNAFRSLGASLKGGTLLKDLVAPFQGLGDLILGPNVAGKIGSGISRIKGMLDNFFHPKVPLLGNAKAFQAFDMLASSVDDIASKVRKFGKFSKLFSGLTDDIGKLAKPFKSVGKSIGGFIDDVLRGNRATGLFSRALRVLPGPLRLIAAGFAGMGFDKLVGGLWDAVGGFEGIGDALSEFWNRLRGAFSAGGMAGVMSELGSMIMDGLRGVVDAIANADWGDIGSSIWDWLVDSVKNITWQDIVMALIVGIGLMLGGLPGILLGLFGPMIWSWIADATRDITWSDIGSALLTGFRAVIDGLSAVGGWIADIFRAINWGAVGSVIMDGLSAVGGWIMDALGAADDLATRIWDWFSGVISGINWASAWQTALSVLATVGDWLMTAIRGGSDLATRIWDWFSDVISGIDWAGAFQTALAALTRFGEWVLAAIRGVEGIQNRILDWFSQQIGNIDWANVVQTSLNGLSRFGEWVLTAIRGAVGIGQRILAWFSQQIGDIDWANVVQTSLTGLARFGEWVLERLRGGDPLQRRINAFFRNIFDDIDWGDLASKALDGIQELGGKILEGLQKGAEIGWNSVRNWIETLPGKIKGTLQIDNPDEILMSIGEGIINGLKAGMEAAWNTVSGWIDGLIDSIKRKWSAFAEDFNSTIGQLPGVPDLPTFEPIEASADEANRVAQALLGTIKKIGTAMGSATAPPVMPNQVPNADMAPSMGAEPVVPTPAPSLDMWDILQGKVNAARAAMAKFGTTNQQVATSQQQVTTSMAGAAVVGERLGRLQAFLNDAQEAGIPTAYDYADIIATGSYQSEQLANKMNGLAQRNIAVTSTFRSLGSAMGESVAPAFAAVSTAVSTGMQSATTAIQTGAMGWGAAIASASGAVASGASAAFGTVASSASLGMATATSAVQTGAAGWGIAIGGAGPALGASATTAFGSVALGASLGMGTVPTTITTASAGWGAAMLGQQLGLQLAAITAFDGVRSGAETSLMNVNTTIATQTATWGATLGTALQLIHLAVQVQFTNMVTTASTAMVTMGVNVSTAASLMGQVVAQSMATMATTAASSASQMAVSVSTSATNMALLAAQAAQGMSQSVSQSASQMRSSVTNSALGMAQAVIAAANTMRSGSVSAAVSMASSIVSAMQVMGAGVRNAVSSAFGSIAGIIASSGGSAIAAAYMVGVAIGRGLANGINSMVGAVAAAAANLVAAASVAAGAAALAHSPSRLFMWHGEDIGEGYAIGIERMIPMVASTVRDMVGTSSAIAKTGMDITRRQQAITRSTASGSSGATYNVYQYDYRIEAGAISVTEAGDAEATAATVVGAIKSNWTSVRKVQP